MQTYKNDVDTQIFIRKLWNLSLVPRDDIISTYLKILEDVPQWDEDDKDDHGAGKMLNDGMKNYLAYFERTWVSFSNIIFCQPFYVFVILDRGTSQQDQRWRPGAQEEGSKIQLWYLEPQHRPYPGPRDH